MRELSLDPLVLIYVKNNCREAGFPISRCMEGGEQRGITMKGDFRSPALGRLRDQQVRFAPREKKIEQIEAAERLIGEVEPQKSYPYEYVCFRITGYRPESNSSGKILGEDLYHDLRMLIEELSDSADLAAESLGEQVLTVDELAKRFNVSTKTISRWRELGLVSRRLIFDGRKRVGFLRSSVDRFVKNNSQRVQRGARFSQLTGEQRHEIIERARRMAHAGGCQSEISRRIAKRAGRSVETVRATLRQFDRALDPQALADWFSFFPTRVVR